MYVIKASKTVLTISVMSMDNNFISWTWLSVNLCYRWSSGDSLICLVEVYLNFMFL